MIVDESRLHERLTEVFREVLVDDSLVLRDEMTSQDISAWDSVTHINLMFAIEQAFGIRFRGNELADLANIGALKKVLMERVAR